MDVCMEVRLLGVGIILVSVLMGVFCGYSEFSMSGDLLKSGIVASLVSLSGYGLVALAYKVGGE